MPNQTAIDNNKIFISIAPPQKENKKEPAHYSASPANNQFKNGN